MLNIYAFAKGIRIEPVSSSNASREGEIEVINGKLRVHDGSVSREIVSLDQSQVLSNKTLNNTNTVSLLDTLFTLQDNVDNTKQLQFQLSGITTGTTRTLTVPDVNDTLVTLAATQTLINKTINILDTNLTIQDDVDNTKQIRFEASGITTGTTRTFTLQDANSTLATLQTNQTFTGEITHSNKLNIEGQLYGDAINDSSGGTNITLATPSKFITKLTGSIVSIDGITAPTSEQLAILTNDTGSPLLVNNETGTITNQIITGSGIAITLESGASLLLYYDVSLTKWKVIGGVGSGSQVLRFTAGENLTAGDAVYISQGVSDGGRTLGRVYKAIADGSVDRYKFIGFVKSTVLTGADAEVQISGDFNTSGLLTSITYYLSPVTPGLITVTRPTGYSEFIVVCGTAKDTNTLIINAAGYHDAIRNKDRNAEVQFTDVKVFSGDSTISDINDYSYLILSNTSSNIINLTIPSGTNGQILNIKCRESSVSPIRISTSATNGIDIVDGFIVLYQGDANNLVYSTSLSQWLIV
jgi:hypothetical protein